MTNLITVIERNVKQGEDRFAVVIGGEVFTSHPTRRGAEKIAQAIRESRAREAA